MTKLKSSEKEAIAGYLFILPNFIGFAVFTLVPVILSFVLSFVNWDMLSAPKFIGLSNFINLVGFHKEAALVVANDPLFWKCVGNTLFLMLIIPIEMVAALLLALSVNQKIIGIKLFRFLRI